MSPLLTRKKTCSARKHASRENGKLGGRPKKDRKLEEYTACGPPPEDLLDRVGWMNKLLAVDTWHVILRVAEPGMSGELRANLRAMLAAIPYERLRAAEKAVAEDKLRVNKSGRRAPELENAASESTADVAGPPPGGAGKF
jgi:hypothetical protein